MPRKIYLATSWKNLNQPLLLTVLRQAGHEVYDFRNPAPGNQGFAWKQADPNAAAWAPPQFVDVLTTSPVCAAGFKLDMDALNWSDPCVLQLPCGRSAHLEAGYAIGRGKPTIILLSEQGFEPELMYLMAGGAHIVTSFTRVIDLLEKL